MPLITCPHCSTSMEPMAGGICPSCSKNINDRQEVTKSADKAAVRAEIDRLRLSGMSLPAAVKTFDLKPFNPQTVSEVAKEYRDQLGIYRFEIFRLYLFPGIPALLIGVGVTAGTMIYGKTVGIIWHGMIGYGLTSTVIGLVKLWKAR